MYTHTHIKVLKLLFKKHHTVLYICMYNFFNIKFVRFSHMDMYSLDFVFAMHFIIWIYHNLSIFQLIGISDFFLSQKILQLFQ